MNRPGNRVTPHRSRLPQRATRQFNNRQIRSCVEEGTAVLVEPSDDTDAGTIRVNDANLPPSPTPAGNAFSGQRVCSKGAPATLPQLVAEVEQCTRLVAFIAE